MARRTKLGLWLGGGIAVLVVIAVLLPNGMRWVAVDWLEERGVSAEIGDVGFNPFTGRLQITDARGEGKAGDGFRIDSLALDLEYWPLFSKKLYLAELTIGKGRIDVVRTADNHLRVGGLSVLGDDQSEGGSKFEWGYGFELAAIEALTVDYKAPDFSRKVTLASSTASDVASWRTNGPVPVDARINLGDTTLQITGKLQPFGDRITSDFDISLGGLGLDLVAPLAKRVGADRIAGTLSLDLAVTTSYSADGGLSVTTQGTAALDNARLKAPKVRIKGGDFDWDGTLEAKLLNKDAAARYQLDGKLALAEADLAVPEVIEVSRGQAAWQGEAQIQVAESGTRSSSDGSFDGKNIDARFPGPNLELTLTELHWQGTSDYGPSVLDHHGKLRFTGPELAMPDAQLRASGKSLAWDGRLAFGVGDGSDAPPPFQAKGSLTGAQIRLIDTRIGRALLAAASIKASGVTSRGAQSAGAERIRASNLRAMARADDAARIDEHPNIASLDRTVVEALTWTNGQGIEAGHVDGDALNALLLRKKQGPWEFNKWLRDGGDSDGGSVPVRIAEIKLGEGSGLVFVDQAVNPAVSLDLNELKAGIGEFSTAPDQTPAEFFVNSRLGRYADVTVNGRINGLRDGITMDARGKADAVNLVSLSGYVAQAVGRTVEQGQLAAETDVSVDRGKLDGSVDLTLKELRLGEPPEGRDQAKQKMGISMATLLDLLRDSDGRIQVAVPVTGNLSDPAFAAPNVANLVQRAILYGLQSAILSYYSPLGIVKATADTLLNLGEVLDFKPVVFSPGEAKLDSDDRQYLDKMAKRLGKRPEAKFSVCGRAVPDDRPALDLPSADSESSSAEARQRLRKLADSRTTVVSDYLVDAGIQDRRLVLCDPSVSRDDDVPRTTISF